MVKHEFKIKTHSPTATLVDRVIRRYAGYNDDIKIAYLRIKDATGTVLGEAEVSPSDWSNHSITKAVTITTAGNASAFTLESSDGAELYRYDLASPVSLKANDVVTITWTIGITLGSNCLSVDYLLENIEGKSTEVLTIDGFTFFEAGTAQKTFNSSNASVNVTPDTTNDRVEVSVTFTSDTSFGYDEIMIVNPLGIGLIRVSATGNVSAGVQTTVKVVISIGI